VPGPSIVSRTNGVKTGVFLQAVSRVLSSHQTWRGDLSVLWGESELREQPDASPRRALVARGALRGRCRWGCGRDYRLRVNDSPLRSVAPRPRSRTRARPMAPTRQRPTRARLGRPIRRALRTCLIPWHLTDRGPSLRTSEAHSHESRRDRQTDQSSGSGVCSSITPASKPARLARGAACTDHDDDLLSDRDSRACAKSERSKQCDAFGRSRGHKACGPNACARIRDCNACSEDVCGSDRGGRPGEAGASMSDPDRRVCRRSTQANDRDRRGCKRDALASDRDCKRV
jgi:hypothetical protein